MPMFNTTHAVRRRIPSPRPAHTAATIALAAGLLLGGCGERDEVASTLHEASVKLQMISAGTGASPAPDRTTEVYEEVRRMVQPIAGQGRTGERAAGHLLIAQATLGQAALATRDATTFDISTRRLEDLVSLRLADFQRTLARAETFAAFDASEELDRIRADRDDLQNELASLQTRREDLLAQIRDLRSQVDELAKEARRERGLAGELRMEMDRVTATEAKEIGEHARLHTRAADGYEHRMGLLEAEADQLDPQAKAVDLEIGRVETLLSDLEDRQSTLDEESQTASQRARRLRADADEIAAEIRAMVVEARGSEDVLAEIEERTGDRLSLLDRRMEGFRQRVERAVELHEEALGAANQAMRDDRQAAALAVARIQQGLASTLVLHADGLGQFGSVLVDLVEVGDALPDSRRFSEALQRVADSQEEAINAAREAYEAAAEAFQQAASGSDAREELERAAERMDRAARAVSGEAVEAISERPRRTRTERSPDAPTVSDGPRQALTNYLEYTTEGRWDESFRMVYFGHPGIGELIEPLVPVMTAYFRLEAASQEAMGESFAIIANREIQQNPRGFGPMGPQIAEFMGSMDMGGAGEEIGTLFTAYGNLTADDFHYEERGGSVYASAFVEGEPFEVTLREIDGNWMVVAPTAELLSPDMEIPPVIGSMVSDLRSSLTEAGRGMERLADQILADEFSGPEPMVRQFVMTIQPVVVAGMQAFERHGEALMELFMNMDMGNMDYGPPR